MFRIAQAVAYLFIVQWAWAAGTDKAVPGTSLSPNLLGFFVGLFILRVERAIDALGERFEEVLTAILPRSLAYKTPQERRQENFKLRSKLEELEQQFETIRPQIRDEEGQAQFEEELRKALALADSENPEGLQEKVADLQHRYELMKKNLGVTVGPVEALLAK